MASNRNRIAMMGRIGSGKTSLRQRLMGEELKYEKTQQVIYTENFVDTPGEFIEMSLWHSEIVNVTLDVGLVIVVNSAIDSQNSIRPNFVQTFNLPAIGVVTKIDLENADIKRSRRLLRYAGVRDKNIFEVSIVTGEGLDELSEAVHQFINFGEKHR